MGFFDFIDPVERRWRDEARQEAKEARQEAKEYLADAKDCEEDYKEWKSDTRRLANDLNGIIQKHNDFKKNVLQELGEEISGTIENFKNFNVTSKVIKMPKIDSASMPDLPSFNVSTFITSMPGGNFDPIKLIFSALSDPYKDLEKAQEQRDKAREYLWKMQEAVDDIRMVYNSLKNTRDYIESEQTAIKQIMEKLRPLIQQLNENMNKNFFSEKEAKFLDATCRIAEKMKKTLEENIIDKSGNVQKNYKIYSDKLKEINSAIPERPTISESSDWIEKIILY